MKEKSVIFAEKSKGYVEKPNEKPWSAVFYRVDHHFGKL